MVVWEEDQSFDEDSAYGRMVGTGGELLTEQFLLGAPELEVRCLSSRLPRFQ